jgi:hypothetical protein
MTTAEKELKYHGGLCKLIAGVIFFNPTLFGAGLKSSVSSIQL